MRPLYAAAAPLCAAWLAFSGIHLVLSRAISGTQLRETSTPSWIPLGLIATEVSIGALLLALAGALLHLAGRLETKYPGRAARLLLAALRYGPAAAGVFFGASSWFSFFNLGQFADVQGIEFALVNGSLFLAYVSATHPEALYLLPLGSVAVSAGGVWGLPRLLRRVPPPVAERAVRITLGLAAATILGAGMIELFRGFATDGAPDPVTGVVHPWSRMYEVRREATTGPLSHAACGVLKSLAPVTPLPEVRRDASGVLRRPRIRMEDYVASVDRASFRPRNVVLVMVDSLRPDGLTLMPRMEEVRREGKYFTDVRTEASHTDYAALCPLSSQYPLRSPKVHRYPQDPPYPRVPLYDVLKAVGYRTALISSQDENWGRMMNYLNTGGLDHIDHAYNPESRNMARNFRGDDKTVDAVIRWLAEPSAKPFFLYLNLQNSHFPYVVPKDWPRRYGKDPDFRMVLGMYPHERLNDVRNLYADSLAFVDAQLGRLVDALRRSQVWDETVFVLLADHGEAFLEHRFGGHGGNIFDEVMKIPLIFRGPGVEAGVDGRPAELIDVPVSLCHLLGIPSHPSFQGIDLFAPAGSKERSRFMVVHTPLATQTGVERGGWKVIYDEPLRLPALYDLRTDPGETRDVSREHPSILRELMKQLTEWRTLQLEYYVNPERMAREYPPILKD